MGSFDCSNFQQDNPLITCLQMMFDHDYSSIPNIENKSTVTEQHSNSWMSVVRLQVIFGIGNASEVIIFIT
jgi:hypothetical protein